MPATGKARWSHPPFCQTKWMPSTAGQLPAASGGEIPPNSGPLSYNANTRVTLLNAAANYSSFIVQAALGIIITPLLLRGLGREQFGLWSVLLTVAGYVGALELGIGVATIRRVAALAANEDREELRATLSTSLRLYVVVAALGAGLLVVFSLALPRFIEGAGLQARLAVLVLGLSQLFTLICNIYPALLFGTGRFSALGAMGLGFFVVGTSAQAVIALTTHDVFAVACANAVVGVIQAIVTRHVAKRMVRLPPGRVGQRFDRKVARGLISSGYKNALIGVAATASYSSDVLIVGALLSLEAAAAYGVATRAAGIVFSLASRGADVLVPTYAHHAEQADMQRLFFIYRQSVIASWLLAIPCGIVVITAAPGLLTIWLGDVPDGSVTVLQVLVATVVIAVPGSNAFKFFSGINRLSLVTVAALLAAVCNVALSVTLTKAVGLAGPALGTLITAVIYDVVVMPSYLCRICGVRWMSLVRGLAFFIPPLLMTASVGAVMSLADQGAVWTAARAVVLPAVFLVAAVISMGGQQRGQYGRAISRLRKRSSTDA